MLVSCDDGAGSDVAQESQEVEFLNLRVEEIGATRAVVRFETSVETTCEVEWGMAMEEMTNSSTDPDMEPGSLVTIHQVPLEDLAPSTTIYFRAKATDIFDDTYYSEPQSFVTGLDDGTSARINLASQDMGTTILAKSSNYLDMDDDGLWGAANAIDGLMASEWSSNGDGDDAFVTLDFGQARDITAFGFRSRKMANGTSIILSLQLVFDDATTVGPFDTPNPDQRYTFEIDPVTAQTVRVEALTTTGGNTGIREIEMYGAE